MSDAAALKSGIPCPCRRWSFRATRAIGVAPGCLVYFAEERECAKCRRFFVLVFRVGIGDETAPIGIAPLPHPTADALRRALSTFPELSAAYVEAMVASARQLSELRPAA